MTQTDDARGPEPLAFLVRDMMIAKTPVKATGRFEPDSEYLYSRDRKGHAEQMAKMTRGELVPLYARADLATQPDPLADPRVLALEKALRDAGDYIDKGRPQMAQNIIRNAIAALDAGGKDE